MAIEKWEDELRGMVFGDPVNYTIKDIVNYEIKKYLTSVIKWEKIFDQSKELVRDVVIQLKGKEDDGSKAFMGQFIGIYSLVQSMTENTINMYIKDKIKELK
jgi:hypothetical protein